MFPFLNGIHSPSACAGLIWPSLQSNLQASWWLCHAYSTEEVPVEQLPELDGSWRKNKWETSTTTSNTEHVLQNKITILNYWSAWSHLQEHLSLKIIVHCDISIGCPENFLFNFWKNIFCWQVGHVQPLHPREVFPEISQALFHSILQHGMRANSCIKAI